MAATASRYAVAEHISAEITGTDVRRRCRHQMATCQTVLVDTDGSKSSLRAVARAGKIAAEEVERGLE